MSSPSDSAAPPPPPPPSPFDLTALREALGSLLQDPAISRAVDNGQPHRVWRLLLNKRKLARGAEREQIDALLNNRRLFVTKVTKPPTMQSINGIGTSFHGKSEPSAQDGTFIGTLFIVLIFVPVYPLAQYWVANAETKGWYFLGKVPLSVTMRRWQNAVQAGLLTLAITMLGLTFYKNSHSDLRIANGLDVLLEVQIDQEAPTPAPEGVVSVVRKVRTGPHHLTTRTPGGQVVEELDIDIPRKQDVVVYNILGAAPLFQREVVYYQDGKAPTDPNFEEPDSLEVFGGQRFIVRDDVDYVFVTPEQRISMSESSTRETRRRFGIDPGGWEATLIYLLTHEQTTNAFQLAESIAGLEPNSETALAYVVSLLPQVQPQPNALAWLEKFVDRFPESVNAHRTYQTMMSEAGRREEARQRYRQLAEAHPDSFAYRYLRARCEPLTNAVALGRELQKEKPNDPYVLRGLAWGLLQLKQYDESRACFEKLAATDPAVYAKALDSHVLALVGSGRVPAAIQLLTDNCDRQVKTGKLDFETVVLYGQLALLDPAAAKRRSPESYLIQLTGEPTLSDASRLWYVSRVSPWAVPDQLLLTTTNVAFRTSVLVTRAAVKDLDEAVRLAAPLSDQDLLFLEPHTRIVLAAQAQLKSDRALAERLLKQLPGLRQARSIRAYVLERQAAPELDELDLETRAVLAFADARRELAAGRSPAADYQRALANDLLHRLVTQCVQQATP